MRSELDTTDSCAHHGCLTPDRSVVETLCLTPVGTYDTVKGMMPKEIKATDA